MVNSRYSTILLIFLVLNMSGCSYIINSVTEKQANNLSTAILSQNDPETVRDAAPAYLVLIDGLIEGDPERINLLLAGAKLNNAYASVFVDDPQRSQRMTDKAWKYSQRALCLSHPEDCHAYQATYPEYVEFLETLDDEDLPVLYSFASSWASWIQTHADDWNARADLAKVEASMQRVLELDNSYENGEPQVYLGVLHTILPPALGGKAEQAKSHFEQALTLSQQRNLMFKVIYAEKYARLLFDRELHDRLLQEVMLANPEQPNLTLMNTIAQQKAQILLDSADDYF